MSWSQITNTTSGGNGLLEFMLVIEGYDYAFVTSQEMASLSSYPRRINGLTRTGLSLSQKVQFYPDVKLALNSNNFIISDYQEQATKAFYRKPTWTAYLYNNIAPTDTVMVISTTEGLSVGDYIWIGSECMKVVGLYADNQNRVLVQRGALSSTPQSHFTLTDMGIPIRPLIQNVPFTVERRRAYLYAYGNGDNITDLDHNNTGTLIWRGVVLTQPSLSQNSSTEYNMEIGPITELLQTEIGIDSDKITLRGINLGTYKWAIHMQFVSGSSVQGQTTSDTTIYATGFYEDIYELASDLNAQAQAATTSTTVKCGVQVSNLGQELLFTQYSTNLASSTASCRWSTIALPMPYAYGNFSTFQFPQNDVVYEVTNNRVQVAGGTTITANTVYATRLMNKSFPAQISIYCNEPPIDSTNPYVNADSSFGKRFYLNVDTTSTYLQNLIVFNADKTKQVATSNYDNYAKADFTVDNSLRYIQVNLKFTSAADKSGFVVQDNNFVFFLGTAFGQEGVSQEPASNVVDFVDNLISQSPYNTPNGVITLITSNDIDNADMRDELNKISMRSFQANRKYLFFKKSGALEKILSEEFKLLGVYPALTREGKLTIRSLRNVNPYEEPDYTLDANDILTDNGYIAVQSNAFGIINSVLLKVGYSPATQKFEGPAIEQKNVESVSVYGKMKQLEIAPVSVSPYYTDSDIRTHLSDFEDVLYRATTLFSKDYKVLTVEVPIKFYDATIGSTIRIKNKQLPNYKPDNSTLSTRRGSARILGTIIGKDFSLEKGWGSLTILVSDQEFLGTDNGEKAIYAPDALLSSVSNVGGDSWLCTFDTTYASMFMPSNKTQLNFWNVGDAVRLDRFNSDQFYKGYGVISEVIGTGNNLQLVVDFSSPGSTPTTFGNSGTQWMLKVSDFNDTRLTTTQQQYAFNDGGNLSTPDNIQLPGKLNRVLSF